MCLLRMSAGKCPLIMRRERLKISPPLPAFLPQKTCILPSRAALAPPVFPVALLNNSFFFLIYNAKIRYRFQNYCTHEKSWEKDPEGTQWKTAARCNVQTGETRLSAVDVLSASRNDGRQRRSLLEVSNLLTLKYRRFMPTFWFAQLERKGNFLLTLFELMGQNLNQSFQIACVALTERVSY